MRRHAGQLIVGSEGFGTIATAVVYLLSLTVMFADRAGLQAEATT